MTGSCPCCGGDVALDVPAMPPTPMRLLLMMHRAGDHGVSLDEMADGMGIRSGNVLAQISKLRDYLSGSGVGVETCRVKGPSRYRVVQGGYVMSELIQRIADVLDEYESVRPTMTTANYLELADMLLCTIHEPPARLVAKVADRMKMDATKVAGIWMMFIEEGRGG